MTAAATPRRKTLWETSFRLQRRPADGMPELQFLGKDLQDPSGRERLLGSVVVTMPVEEITEARLHELVDAAGSLLALAMGGGRVTS